MITACASRFERACPPIVWSGPRSSAVVLLDGSGSWGTGAEAAAWVRDGLARLLQSARDVTRVVVADALAHLVTELPPELRNDEFGWSFSVAAAVVQQMAVHVGVCGAFSVAAALPTGIEPLWTPPRLLDDLVASGRIRAEDAEQHALWDSLTCPFFGEETTTIDWLDPILLGDDKKVVLGCPALARRLQLGRVHLGGDVVALRDAVEASGGRSFATALIDARPFLP